MQLQKHGIECELVSSIPEAGVILSHSDFWPSSVRPSATQLFVEIKPDRQKIVRYAQMTVVQSSLDPLLNSHLARAGRVEVVNYWPQPGLIPRDPNRADGIKAAGFFGNKESFLREVVKLHSELASIGLSFTMVPRSLWNDYSQVDLIIAVRNNSAFLSKAVRPHLRVELKPPNKLTNGWLAGVPSILSPEPSYLQLRRSKADFIIASTIDDIVSAAKHLKDNRLAYLEMRNNCGIRATEFGAAMVREQWKGLIEEKLVPAYRRWTTSKVYRYFISLSDGFLKTPQ